MALTATPAPASPRLPLVRGVFTELDILPGVVAAVHRDASGKHRVTFLWLLDFTDSDIGPADEAEIAVQLRAWQEIVERFAPAKGVKQVLPKPQIVQTHDGDVLLCAGSLVAVGCEFGNAGAYSFCAGHIDVGRRCLEVATKLATLDSLEFEPHRTRRSRHVAATD